MKTKLFLLLICSLLICNLLFAQNITNTLCSVGTFTIKDGTTSFLTLSQSTGYLSLNRSLVLTGTTSSTTGVLYKGSTRFMHNYQAPGTFGDNLFMGLFSGNFTMSGSSEQASYNTAFGDITLTGLTTGYQNSAFGSFALDLNSTGHDNSAFGMYALFSNTIGNNNSGFGSQSLYSNTSGNQNSAFGYQALYNNTSGSNNSGFGFQSLYSNGTGMYNSAFGYQSLYVNSGGLGNSSFGYKSLFSNTSGSTNSAFGFQSLNTNTTGASNTAVGYESLVVNTTGSSNTAVGFESLFNNRTGSGNVCIGDMSGVYLDGGNNNIVIGKNAGSSLLTGSNNICIGFDSDVPSFTSNQVRIGNTSITYAGVQVAWTITSDRRLKSNILTSNLGLNFISKLNPVSYTRTNDEKQKTEFGFIAQEVDETLKQTGVENTGMVSIDDGGTYSLRYNDLLAPIVKSIQELKEENDRLKEEVDKLREVNEKVEKLEKIVSELNRGNKTKTVSR